MSSAPSKTGCLDSFTTKPQDKTEPAASMPDRPEQSDRDDSALSGRSTAYEPSVRRV